MRLPTNLVHINPGELVADDLVEEELLLPCVPRINRKYNREIRLTSALVRVASPVLQRSIDQLLDEDKIQGRQSVVLQLDVVVYEGEG